MSNINVNTITPLSGVTGTVSVSGSLLVSGSITANGNIILGDSTADSVSLGAEISSSIIPDANDTYDLGSSAKRWSQVYAQSGSLNYLNVNNSLIVNSLTVTGSDTITNWGNFKNRFPTNDRYFTVTTNPTVAGGWKEGVAVPGNTTGSYPHLHFQLSGSGVAGIGLLNPQHTLHISSSGAGKAFYVDGTAAFPGNISSSLTPLTNTHTGFNIGSSTKLWNNSYVSASHMFQLNPIPLNPAGGGPYAQTLSGRNFVKMSGSFIPYADDKFDLGNQYFEWRDLWVDGTAYIDTLSGVSAITATSASISYLSGSSPIIVGAAMIPDLHQTHDLGSSTKLWNNFYASSSNIFQINPIPLNPAGGGPYASNLSSRNFVKMSGSFIPHKDNHFDLGNQYFEWRDLWVDGIAYIDTAQIHTKLDISNTNGASTDAAFHSINGPRVTLKTLAQAQINDGTFAKFELRNTSIEAGSIVMGGITGNTVGTITGSIITAAVIAAQTASIQIHNETGLVIANDAPFTASFVVL